MTKNAKKESFKLMSENNDIVPLVIDLEEIKKKENQLNESFLRMFGGLIQGVLKRMFDQSAIPVTVRGRKTDVNALAQVLGREKRYMDSYLNHGLGDPRTSHSKWELERAVGNFERETGIKWPLT
jgi:hypothetical protein